MMKMKNHWMRFCGHTLLSIAVGATWLATDSAICHGQQARGNQGVAPPAAGYGGRPVNNNAPANGAGQQRPGQPGTQPSGVQQQGVQQPVSASQNQPNLNPQLRNSGPQSNGPASFANGTGNEVVTKDPYQDRPITPQEQAHIDQILQYWEKSTADIKRYACKFKRWQYNSTDNFVEQLAQQLKADMRAIATTIAAGEVKYMAPDKGMFKVDKLVTLTGQVEAKNRPEYKEFENKFGEWWLCDGEAVYEYDRSLQKCTIHELPKEMQGTAILDSPMPFVFGINANKIKERYWVRALAPPNDAQGKPRNDIFVIEVYPKFQSDAANYDHVQVFLDRAEFLPVMMVKFNTEHLDEPGSALHDNREVFEFAEREKNESLLKKLGGMFGKEFIPFDVPKNWQTTRIPYAPPAAQDIRSAAANPIGSPAANIPNLGNPPNVGNPNVGNPNSSPGNAAVPNGRGPTVPLQSKLPTPPNR